MKKALLWIAVVVLIGCIVFLIFFSGGSKNEEETASTDISAAEEEKILSLVAQIEANVELETYKNNLDLYQKLIDMDFQNIDWHVGLANTYQTLGQTSKFKRACQNIIDEFPDEPTGYLMLMKYYDLKDNENQVLKFYNTAPSSIKANKEFLNIYQKYEWTNRFRDRRYENIGICSSDYFVYQYKGFYGYRKNNLIGNISAKYEIARPFIEDHAAVYKDKEWYFIDKSGHKVIATKENVQDLYSFSDGYAVAKIDGKYGYINAFFKKFSFEYDDATSFMNGVAAVKKNGKWALIDKSFQQISAFIYDDVIRDEANVCSRQNVILLKYNGSYQILNNKGHEVATTTFSEVKSFYSEYAPVKQNGKWGFMDKNGNLVISCSYDNATSFSSGLAAVQKNGKWGFIDKNGNTVIPFAYEYASTTSDKGVVVVKDDEDYRFIQFLKFN